MNMIKFYGPSGFIVAVSITLLLSGLIVYYFNSRFAALEKLVLRQQQILSTFVTNIRNDIKQPSVNSHSSGATPEAMAAAQRFMGEPCEKISVSDNESDDESDDESDESDDDSDGDTEDNVDDDTNVADSNSIKVIELTNSDESNILEDETNLNTVTLSNLISVEQIDDKNSVEELNDSSEDEDLEDLDSPIYEPPHSTAPSQFPEDSMQALSSSQPSPPPTPPPPSTPPPTSTSSLSPVIEQYKKLNVSALKTLVIEKNLANGSKMSKMRKNELINLLTNNN